MPNLTDTQLIVLSNAAARDDGAAVAPSGLNKAAVAKVASSLIARKLMREMRSKPVMAVWRGEDGKSISLIITRAGRDAIGVESKTPKSDRAAAATTSAAAVAGRVRPRARPALAPSKP